MGLFRKFLDFCEVPDWDSEVQKDWDKLYVYLPQEIVARQIPIGESARCDGGHTVGPESMQSGEALQAGEGGSPGGTGEDGFADGEGWPDSDARASGEVGSSPPLCLYGVPLREVIEIIRANSDDDMALGFRVSTDDGKYENAPILPPSCCGEVEFYIEDDKNSQRGISLKVNGRGPYALDTSEEFAAAVAGELSGFSQRSKKARAVAQGSSGPFIGRRRRSEPFVIKGASWRSASESRRPDCESASTDGDAFEQQMPFGSDEVSGRAEEGHPRYVTCGSFVRALQRAEQSYPGLGLSEVRFEGCFGWNPRYKDSGKYPTAGAYRAYGDLRIQPGVNRGELLVVSSKLARDYLYTLYPGS